jgi:hypothetical protein
METVILSIVRRSEPGAKYIQTLMQIHASLVERMMFDTAEGNRMLGRLTGIITEYIQFNLRQALLEYCEIRIELMSFIAELASESEVRHNTWVKIGGIMDMLVTDAENFLQIAASEIERMTGERPSQ